MILWAQRKCHTPVLFPVLFPALALALAVAENPLPWHRFLVAILHRRLLTTWAQCPARNNTWVRSLDLRPDQHCLRWDYLTTFPPNISTRRPWDLVNQCRRMLNMRRSLGYLSKVTYLDTRLRITTADDFEKGGLG